MKRKFSKIVSMMLAVVMLMSLIQLPAFAAKPVYRDPLANQNKVGTASTRQHRNWHVPYGDEVAHFDYYAEDGANPVLYKMYYDTDAMHVDPDGVLVMTSKYADPEEQNSNRVMVSSDYFETSAHSGNINRYANSPFIFNFDDPYCYSSGGGSIHSGADDTSSAIFLNAQPATDPETGNNYIVSDYTYSALGGTYKNFISIPQNWMRPGADEASAGAMNSFIIIADVLFKPDEDFVFHIRYSGSDPTSDWRKYNYLTWNHETKVVTDYDGRTVANVEPGWHEVKMMLSANMKAADNPNPYRYTSQMYTLFFDQELLTPTRSTNYNFTTHIATSRPNNLIQFQGSGGIDNFKLYGTSTPHAYNVGIEGTPKSGATVSGSASMACVVNYTNAETHYVYSYYVSDTADSAGSYTKVESTDPSDSLYLTDEGKLAINGDFTGRYIKTGARVWNRGGMSPEIMSKQVYEIQGFDSITVTGGTTATDARFRLGAPFAGTLNWSFLDAPEGVSLTEDGLFTVPYATSDGGVLKIQNVETGELSIKNLNFIPNVTTYGNALSEVIEPVLFQADIDLADTTEITVGSKTFSVGSDGSIDGVASSDGSTFKFIVEDDVYYAFIEDEFIGSDAFTEDITSITTDGTVNDYYAGSPLVTDGAFITYSIADAIDSSWIKAPIIEFYNESGVYPEGYTYQWYLNGAPVSTDATFKLPGGSLNKTVYCDLTAVTDNAVTRCTNTLTVGSQYNLTVNQPGDFTVSLNTENKDVYMFIVGDNKTVFVADMSDGDPVTAHLDSTDNYNMMFANKADLSPRGLATRILADTSYTDTLLPDGSVTNLVVLTRDSDLSVASSGAVLFEDPATYEEILNLLPVDGNQADVSAFIRDVKIVGATATTYADFAAQPEGFYNIISIDEAGNVSETDAYNRLYEFFAVPANYDYVNFEAITQKALSLSDEEMTQLLTQLAKVNNKGNIAPLIGTNGEYFPAVVFFQHLSELSAPSDASLKPFESHLEKAGLPTDVAKVMEFTTYYASEMATINPSVGLETALSDLADHMVLTEVREGFNSTNIRLALAFIGSSKYNSASKEAQTYAAQQVARKTFDNIPALKSAVETAVDNYVPVEPETNEKEKNDYSGSGSSKVTITGSVTAPLPPVVEPQPSTPSFSDTSASHWAFGYIEKMADAGVLNGYDGNFRPDDNITRAEFVKVLCTAFDIKAEGNVDFNDVSADSWYAPYVNVLAAAGIAKGDNGNFRPDDQISRQDAAVLLQRVLAYTGIGLENGELSFTDANDMSDYAKDAIASLAKAGIINGMEDGSYAPVANITRAQVAKLICVAIELGGDK